MTFSFLPHPRSDLLPLLPQGEESLGMAMVFTLASHLREALTNYVVRKRKEADEADDKRRNEEIEVSFSGCSNFSEADLRQCHRRASSLAFPRSLVSFQP